MKERAPVPSRAAEPGEPTFLVGAERSGTTMLRLMLDHHPSIAWYGELEFLVDQLPEHGGWPDPAAYARALAVDRRFAASGFSIDAGLDYPALMASFLRQIRERFRKPVIGTTIHTHFDRVLRIWPRARFIHLVRDPRDVARSCIAMGWAGNVWTGASGWITAESTWSALRRTLSPERWHEARFETLVRDPTVELDRICRFLGVPFDAAMLDYHRDTSYERPDAKLVEQWRSKLRPGEIALVEARVGHLLAERGYAASGAPPIAVGAARRLRLAAQDRWYRLRFRQRRYGLPLWLADVVSRRARLRPWRESVRLRLNAVDRQHLR